MLYTGANSGSTGFFDNTTGKYALYITGPGDAPSLARYELDTLESPVDPANARTIDLGFLGGIPLSFTGARICAPASCPASIAAALRCRQSGFSSGWYWSDAS
jgi:hypothetical protein